MFIILKKRFIVYTSLLILFLSLFCGIKSNGIDLIKAVSVSNKPLPIYSVKREDNKIAVTFNCAWDGNDIDDYINLLNENNINCTFFILGEWGKNNKEQIKKLYNNGNEIASHGFSHKSYDTLSAEEIKNDIEKSKQLLNEQTGETLKLIRFPSGAYDENSLNVAKNMGLKVIQWDLDSRDWKNKSSKEIISFVKNNIKSGSILLFHTAKENSFIALKELIPWLKSQGYELTTVSNLIYDCNYKIDHAGCQIKNDWYSKFRLSEYKNKYNNIDLNEGLEYN